jgi:hypothetical protein
MHVPHAHVGVPQHMPVATRGAHMTHIARTTHNTPFHAMHRQTRALPDFVTHTTPVRVVFVTFNYNRTCVNEDNHNGC